MCAETVAEAFDAMYYLEQAARVTVKALSTGQKLKIVDDKVLSLLTHDIVRALEGHNAFDPSAVIGTHGRAMWRMRSYCLTVKRLKQ